MPKFYLEPKNGDTRAPSWAMTFIREGCWVIANSEDDARELVAQTAFQFVAPQPGRKNERSPWFDPNLADCRRDDAGPEVQEGEIVTRSGRRHRTMLEHDEFRLAHSLSS